MPHRQIFRLLSALVVALVAGCAGTPPPAADLPDEARIAALTRDIQALGPEVDPAEAARAARIAIEYPRRLAVQYGVTDAPLIHNMKVNAGLRPRGLCWHWAHDMEDRLRAEDFRTLDLHQAIANADATFRIEHSSVLIGARGGDMYDALLLDPWRYGGTLYWGLPGEDASYKWRPRQEVWDYKRERRAGLNPAPL